MEDIQAQVAAQLDEQAADFEAITLRLSWVMHRRLEQRLDAFQLTLPQYMALTHIQRQAHGCSMSALADASHQLSATMTGIIDRLAERGLVVRERDERDRRALRVQLTDAGRALMERVSAAKRAWTREYLSQLTSEDRDSIIALSRHFLSVVESTGIDTMQAD